VSNLVRGLNGSQTREQQSVAHQATGVKLPCGLKAPGKIRPPDASRYWFVLHKPVFILLMVAPRAMGNYPENNLSSELTIPAWLRWFLRTTRHSI